MDFLMEALIMRYVFHLHYSGDILLINIVVVGTKA